MLEVQAGNLGFPPVLTESPQVGAEKLTVEEVVVRSWIKLNVVVLQPHVKCVRDRLVLSEFINLDWIF